MTKNARPRKVRAGNTTRHEGGRGSWGSLAAAGGAVIALFGLLYASCQDKAPAVAVPEAPPAATTVQTTEPAAVPKPTQPAARKAQGENWNDGQIAWQSYDAGISRAKTEHKPVCLVFFTDWCPHCRNYSNVFSDPRIVAKSRDFIMIRLNADDVPAIADAHAPDGTYVPRTFFLSSEGKILADVHAPRPRYVHFYDESNPESLLAGMDAALQKTRSM